MQLLFLVLSYFLCTVLATQYALYGTNQPNAQNIGTDQWFGTTTGTNLAVGDPENSTVWMYKIPQNGSTAIPISTAFFLPQLPSEDIPRKDTFFGYSIATFGDGLLIGAPCDIGGDNVTASGSAWFFRRKSDGNWTLVERFVIPNEVSQNGCNGNPADGFGSQVSIATFPLATFIVVSGNGVVMQSNCTTTCSAGNFLVPPRQVDPSYGKNMAISADGKRIVVASPPSPLIDIFYRPINGDFQYETTLNSSLIPGNVHSMVISSWGASTGDHVLAIGDIDNGKVYIFEYWESTTSAKGPTGYWYNVQTLNAPANSSGFGRFISMRYQFLVIGSDNGFMYYYQVSNTDVWTSGDRYTLYSGFTIDPFYAGPLPVQIWFSYTTNSVLGRTSYNIIIFAQKPGFVYYFRPYCDPGFYGALCENVCPLVPVDGGFCNDGPTGNGLVVTPPGVLPIIQTPLPPASPTPTPTLPPGTPSPAPTSHTTTESTTTTISTSASSATTSSTSSVGTTTGTSSTTGVGTTTTTSSTTGVGTTTGTSSTTGFGTTTAIITSGNSQTTTIASTTTTGTTTSTSNPVSTTGTKNNSPSRITFMNFFAIICVCVIFLL